MLIHLLRTYLRRYPGWIVAIIVFQGLQTAGVLMLPAITARIIDNGVVNGDTGYIVRMGGIMLGVTALQVVFAVGAVFYGARTAMAFGRDVRKDLFAKVTGFATQEVNQFGAASLITRITNDVQQVQMFVLMSATLLVAGPIMIVGGVIMAVREDGPLSLLLLASVPALVISVGLVVVKLVPNFTVMQERIDEVNRVLREQITGIRVVRAFVRERHEAERFSVANSDLTAVALRAGRLMAFIFPSVMLVLNLSSIAAIWLGAGRIDSGHLQVGELVAFLSYLVQILMSVMMGTFVAVMAPRAAVCADRIVEVDQTPPSIVVAADPVTEFPAPLDVRFDDVGFAYPGAEAPVLEHISFTATPGTTTAIIGGTGSGKTTLVNLLPRMYDPTHGVVSVGGVDVAAADPESLWSLMGLVPQKPYLFSGTVASNLRMSKPEATDEELWEALRIAQGEDFVRAMPGGLDGPIAQGGSSVSGGQRQRLAIARAVLRRPAIYLFDDSFSALDLSTDARLRAALAPVTSNSVVITVAQRVSTIIRADQIIVLDAGRIVGVGTHDELLGDCETYREIVDSQLTEEEAA